MITLLIADDHPLYRDALKGALSLSLPDLTLLEAGDLTATVDILQKQDVDLLLLDLHMPGSNDLFGLLHIRKLYPDLPVAVVSGTPKPFSQFWMAISGYPSPSVKKFRMLTKSSLNWPTRYPA